MPERGQALVELALIVPIAMVLLLVAGDLARFFGSQVALEGAARAGALEASRHPTSFQAGLPCDASVNRIMCAVLNETHGSFANVTAGDVTLTCDPSPCAEGLGNTVKIDVVGQFQLLTPFLAPFTGGQTLDLGASAVAQIAVHPAITAVSPTPGPTPTPTPTPTPEPTPTPTPPPGPTPDPTPTPTPAPTPTPTPMCLPPFADFSINPISGKKKKTSFSYADLSTSDPTCPLTWSWNFGDGAGDSISTLQNPTHVYQAQGVYTVTLVVSNNGGSSSRFRAVTVTP